MGSKRWDCISLDGYVVGVAFGDSEAEAALYAINALGIKNLSHVEEQENPWQK